jgi:hypothetical protein
VLRGEAPPEEVEARATEAAKEEEIPLSNKDYFWDWEG